MRGAARNTTEGKLSADGLYRWDGVQWVSTLSPDGRWRWNGTAWVAASNIVAASHDREPLGPRVETSWTGPLQYSVAGWYALQALWAASLPFWLSGQMSQAFVEAVQRQQKLYPEASPPPPADYVTTMNNIFTGFLWVVAIVGIVVSLVVVVGALQRWTWMHYAVIVLLGLSTLSLLLNIVNAFARSAYPFPVIVPSWVNVVLIAFGLANAALFGWMLVALVQRGPWAMARGADI